MAMTRRRSSAPGRDRSDRHRSLPILLLIVVAVLVVACGGAAASGTPEAGTASPTAGDASPGDEVTPGPETSEEPTESAEAPETETPESEEPTEPTEPSETASADPTDDASSDPGAAAACTGTAENRDFYGSVAAAVGWTVYCPVLPKGWFVESGQYRLAGGGRMEIGYRGPSGARFTLREGAFCSQADGCAPAGTEMGSSAFGDRDGTLIGADDGGWAIVVDAGEKPSWLIVGSSLDEAAFREIAADLIAVDG
jgi:hypothetical protein